ncbi:MAG: hypothetical protein ACXVXW_11215 [Mycobacteriaceae bacterium]
MEFDAVIMPYLNDHQVPWPDVVAAFNQEEADAREARLLPTRTGLWTDLT